MIKKTIILLNCFIFFYRFTSLVCGEKNILANLTRSRIRLGKKSGAGAAWKKVRSRSRLKKSQEPEPLGEKIRSQSRSRSRKKICRLPSPDLNKIEKLSVLYLLSRIDSFDGKPIKLWVIGRISQTTSELRIVYFELFCTVPSDWSYWRASGSYDVVAPRWK